MSKKTITKYVVEVLLPQELRDKYKANPQYGRGNLKGWNGEGKVYAINRHNSLTLTLDLNSAESYKRLKDAERYAWDVTNQYWGIHYPTRVIEVQETRVILGYASNIIQRFQQRYQQ